MGLNQERAKLFFSRVKSSAGMKTSFFLLKTRKSPVLKTSYYIYLTIKSLLVQLFRKFKNLKKKIDFNFLFYIPSMYLLYLLSQAEAPNQSTILMAKRT